MRDVGALVPFTSVRDRCEIRGVCLEKYPFQRNLLYVFRNGCFLLGQYSSVADVPVSESLQFMEGLHTSAVCMENSVKIEMAAFLQYVDYLLCRFSGMDYDR